MNVYQDHPVWVWRSTTLPYDLTGLLQGTQAVPVLGGGHCFRSGMVWASNPLGFWVLHFRLKSKTNILSHVVRLNQNQRKRNGLTRVA